MERLWYNILEEEEEEEEEGKRIVFEHWREHRGLIDNPCTLCLRPDNPVK